MKAYLSGPITGKAAAAADFEKLAGGAYAIIESMPAADVVPVVRCKECANFRRNANGGCYCNEYGGAITPEDYCSRAAGENEPPAR